MGVDGLVLTLIIVSEIAVVLALVLFISFVARIRKERKKRKAVKSLIEAFQGGKDERLGHIQQFVHKNFGGDESDTNQFVDKLFECEKKVFKSIIDYTISTKVEALETLSLSVHDLINTYTALRIPATQGPTDEDVDLIDKTSQEAQKMEVVEQSEEDTSDVISKSAEEEPAEEVIDSDAEPAEEVIDLDAEPAEEVVDLDAEPAEEVIDLDAEPAEDVVDLDAEPAEEVIDLDAEPAEEVIDLDDASDEKINWDQAADSQASTASDTTENDELSAMMDEQPTDDAASESTEENETVDLSNVSDELTTDSLDIEQKADNEDDDPLMQAMRSADAMYDMLENDPELMDRIKSDPSFDDNPDLQDWVADYENKKSNDS